MTYDASHLGTALATIAACGGAGAFIDFCIGKRGQQRVKDSMETWWLRLSYMRWTNIGRDEALFAVNLIDRAFGSRFFSWKRLLTAVLVVIAVGSLYFVDLVTHNASFPDLRKSNYDLQLLVISVVSFGISLSITRFAAVRVAALLSRWPPLNLFGLASLLIFQYFMLCYWPTIMIAIHTSINELISAPSSNLLIGLLQQSIPTVYKGLLGTPIAPTGQLHRLVSSLWPNATLISQPTIFILLSCVVLGAIPYLIRLSITAIFAALFFLQSVQGPIMALWARTIESDKPAFTLLFGGLAAIAKAIQAIVMGIMVTT